ncbi:MAG: hypothetical protein IPI34_14275 [bacterium]|nr:hypothetical protein [bacterium]
MVLEPLASGVFDIALVNIANGDMVGHTGVMLRPRSPAVSAVDGCSRGSWAGVRSAPASMVLTADHGNCER